MEDQISTQGIYCQLFTALFLFIHLYGVQGYTVIASTLFFSAIVIWEFLFTCTFIHFYRSTMCSAYLHICVYICVHVYNYFHTIYPYVNLCVRVSYIFVTWGGMCFTLHKCAIYLKIEITVYRAVLECFNSFVCTCIYDAIYYEDLAF